MGCSGKDPNLPQRRNLCHQGREKETCLKMSNGRVGMYCSCKFAQGVTLCKRPFYYTCMLACVSCYCENPILVRQIGKKPCVRRREILFPSSRKNVPLPPDSHGNVPLIPLGGLCLLHSIFASPPNIHLWLCQCCR